MNCLKCSGENPSEVRLLCNKHMLEKKKSFLSFTEFWLATKVVSEHGKDINSKIIEELKSEISLLQGNTEEKMLQVRHDQPLTRNKSYLVLFGGKVLTPTKTREQFEKSKELARASDIFYSEKNEGAEIIKSVATMSGFVSRRYDDKSHIDGVVIIGASDSNKVNNILKYCNNKGIAAHVEE